MRRGWVVLLFFATLIGGGLIWLRSIPITNKDVILERLSSYIFDRNQYDIHVQNLDPVKLRITWQEEFDPSERTIYEYGEFVRGIGREYGKNKFTIYYEGKAVGRTGHFKTKNWGVHKYNFIIIKEASDSFTIDLKIKGYNGNDGSGPGV